MRQRLVTMCHEFGFKVIIIAVGGDDNFIHSALLWLSKFMYTSAIADAISDCVAAILSVRASLP